MLQFDIELMEGQPRNSSSANGHLSRRSLLRLPTAMAVAALVEAKDPLESSIGMQVGLGRQPAASCCMHCDAYTRLECSLQAAAHMQCWCMMKTPV